MSALSFYYEAIENGNLPAAVPIQASDTDGMATVVFNTYEDAVAQMALSKHRPTRGLLAIYACRAAREAVAEDLGMMTP